MSYSLTALVLDKKRKSPIMMGRDKTSFKHWRLQPETNHELDYEKIITEDDAPVDNIPSEKQQRLLTESLYNSKEKLAIGWPFAALANVGLFDEAYDKSGNAIYIPPIVPDVMLSIGVQISDKLWEKCNRSYFVSEFGKIPEVVIEIVSNEVGNEDGNKKNRYADMGVTYYVIYDPLEQLGKVLRIYELDEWTSNYNQLQSGWLSGVKLELALWQGEFEGVEGEWLRWYDEGGNLVLNGKEQSEKERRLKEFALQRANEEQKQKELAVQRANKERQQKELAIQHANEERQQKELAIQRTNEERQQKELAVQRANEERQQKELAVQRTNEERQQKELAVQRANEERQQKELAVQRAEYLLAKLQLLGIDM